MTEQELRKLLDYWEEKTRRAYYDSQATLKADFANVVRLAKKCRLYGEPADLEALVSNVLVYGRLYGLLPVKGGVDIVDKSEIIALLRKEVRTRELAKEYFDENPKEIYRPDLLQELAREREIFLAAIRWMESEQDND
jgi:ethanolamine utilization cobalamin adenosyltransferase